MDKQVVRVKKEKGEKGEKGKGKETKGKEMEGKETEGKETEGMETGMDGGWTLVNGEGRCAACRKERVSCRINLPAIEGWRRAIQQGKKLRPAGTTCRRCADKKVACELPATADLRIAQKRLRGAKRAASPIASVASSGKRQKTEPEGQKGSTRGKKIIVAKDRIIFIFLVQYFPHIICYFESPIVGLLNGRKAKELAVPLSRYGGIIVD